MSTRLCVCMYVFIAFGLTLLCLLGIGIVYKLVLTEGKGEGGRGCEKGEGGGRSSLSIYSASLVGMGDEAISYDALRRHVARFIDR